MLEEQWLGHNLSLYTLTLVSIKLRRTREAKA